MELSDYRCNHDVIVNSLRLSAMISGLLLGSPSPDDSRLPEWAANGRSAIDALLEVDFQAALLAAQWTATHVDAWVESSRDDPHRHQIAGEILQSLLKVGDLSRLSCAGTRVEVVQRAQRRLSGIVSPLQRP